MKKYYDDPLIAAYMCREFGVKVCLLNTESPDPLFSLSDLAYAIKVQSMGVVIKENYYIHPDSLHIFEPQVGDLITQDGDSFCHKVVSVGDNEQPVCFYTGVLYEPYWSDIIQRNGKHFFMPMDEQ